MSASPLLQIAGESHTSLDRNFQHRRKNNETWGKVHTYKKKKERKKKNKNTKESKVYGILDAVLEQKNLGLIRSNDQRGLQPAQCDHVKSSGCIKQLKNWSVISVYLQLEDLHTVLPATLLFKAKLLSLNFLMSS